MRRAIAALFAMLVFASAHAAQHQQILSQLNPQARTYVTPGDRVTEILVAGADYGYSTSPYYEP